MRIKVMLLVKKSSIFLLKCYCLKKLNIISLFSWLCINFILYLAFDGWLVMNVSHGYIFASADWALLFLSQPSTQATFMVKIQRSLLTASYLYDNIFFISLCLFLFIKEARRLESLQAYQASICMIIQTFLVY